MDLNSSWTSWQYFTTNNTNRITAENINSLVNLNVYPNPTDKFINISFISKELNNYQIALIDSYGKMIFEDHKKEFIGEYVNLINLSKYSPGIYIFKINIKIKHT